MTRRRLHCSFPQRLIKEPLLYNLGRNFSVVPNIRKAEVDAELAVMVLELEGNPQDLDAAVTWLREKGANVEVLDGAEEGA
ncbi:MAG: NIL domain-containing protein [Planctomycetes bacterium]|nr:NIL domain-containing protein [Planctomycetota bacterium]